MKGKLLIVSALVALGFGNIFAAEIEKTPADEVRIYINPGHGSWTSNDRPLQTIGRDPYNKANPDTSGFFESNTNLLKGFALLETLVDAGVPFDRSLNQDNPNPARVGAALDMNNNIVMSHVKAGPWPVNDSQYADAYNRALSEIREEVEVNNFDIFISIHSNANVDGDGVNYPLYLYRGYDDERESVPGSRALCEAIWPYSYSNAHACWSAYSETNINVRGDVNFYGEGNAGYTANNGTNYFGYLGVLKHGVPGFLVEGYFHTYQPARQRAMNDDVCYHEGMLYGRGLIDYMGWTKSTTGEIYGIVRDLHEKFTDPLYHAIARTDDSYKPLNGVTVKLFKGGEEVASYTTDNEYNGAFYFKGLEPGEYTLTYEAEGYKEAFEEYLAPVTVTANETSYVNTFLEAENWTPPAIVYENYPDAVESNPAISVAGAYNVAEDATNDPLADELEGKTVRRQLVRDGKMYVLALDESNEPYIYMVNLADNTVTNISTAGTTLDENRDLKISDIALTADNVLLASSYGENQFDASQVASGDVRGSVAIYKWTNDENSVPTGDPSIWFTSQNSGNYYNAMTGKTLAYTGTAEEGSAIVTAQTTGSSTSLRFVEFVIANSTLASTKFINKDVSAESNYTATKLGDDMQLTVSPLGTDRFAIDGSNTTPVEWQTTLNNNEDAPLMGRIDANLVDAETNGMSFFRFGGHSLMLVPAMADGKVTGIRMLDVTDGFNNAKEIALNGATIDPTEATYASTGYGVKTTVNDEEVVTDAQLEFYVILDGKVTKFSTEGVEQPKLHAGYAYALDATVGETETTFTYKLTTSAPAANIIVTDEAGTETIIPAESAEGENTVNVSNETLPGGTLTWKVEVSGYSVGTPTQWFSDSGYGRVNGVVVNNDPASPYFGTVYASNGTATGTKDKGIYVFDQAMNNTGSALLSEEFSQGNTSSPFRMGLMPDGTLLATDWSDAHSGIFAIDPASLDAANQMFLGEREASGAFIYNGSNIGGGTTGVSVVGTKLYTFAEDYPSGNAGNVLVRYEIGDGKTISAAPEFTYSNATLPNTNVEVRATENGVWASQVRSAGQNTKGAQALMYLDHEGNVLFDSSDEPFVYDLTGCDGAGFAINSDNTILAIPDASGNICVFDLAWSDNVPTLTLRYSFAVNKGSIREMAFDIANNLYVAANAELAVYAIPGVGDKAVTPANGTIFVKESSVEQNMAVSDTKVYPNPASVAVNVEASEEIATVSVFNMSGAAVAVGCNVEGNHAVINVEGLASGVYFVRINDKETVRFIKK